MPDGTERLLTSRIRVSAPHRVRPPGHAGSHHRRSLERSSHQARQALRRPARPRPRPNGKRIYKWHSGYPTKRDAQQARTQLLGALERNTYVPPDKTTLAQYLRQQWLPTIATQVRPGTYAEYRSKAENHLIPAVGQVALQQLTTTMLNALYTDGSVKLTV